MPVEDIGEPTVPVLTILDDWTVDDIETLDDCDDAFAALTEVVLSIQSKLEGLERKGLEATDHYIRARDALRWRKAALQAVQNKRSRINSDRREALQKTDDRRLIECFVRLFPDQFRTCAVAAGIAHSTNEVMR